MVWLVWLWYPLPDIVQKIEEPKGPRGIKEVEELKEILSDVMLKASEGELSETLEGILVHRCIFYLEKGCRCPYLRNPVLGLSMAWWN